MTDHGLPSPIVEVPENVTESQSLSPGIPPFFLFPTQQDRPHHQSSESRRGSQQSLTGGGVMPFYGGLPPPNSEHLTNPRRGSVTGSYTLPVPPDWYRRSGTKLISTGLFPWSGRDSPIGVKKHFTTERTCKAITTATVTSSRQTIRVSTSREKYLQINIFEIKLLIHFLNTRTIFLTPIFSFFMTEFQCLTAFFSSF